MTPVVLLVIGLLLCFGGSRSLRLAVLAAGAGLGWLVASVLGAATGTTIVVALGSAVICLGLSVVFTRFVLLGLGGVLGAQVGASLLAVLSDDPSWLLVLVFVAATAVLGALAGEKYRQAFVGWAAAFAGSSLALASFDAWDGDLGDGLRDAGSTWAGALYTLLWLGLAVAGRSAQRRTREE